MKNKQESTIVVTPEMHDKFDRGDSLTDVELECLIEFYYSIANIKGSIPPKYRLMYTDAINKLSALEGFRIARENQRKRKNK